MSDQDQLATDRVDALRNRAAHGSYEAFDAGDVLYLLYRIDAEHAHASAIAKESLIAAVGYRGQIDALAAQAAQMHAAFAELIAAEFDGGTDGQPLTHQLDTDGYYALEARMRTALADDGAALAAVHDAQSELADCIAYEEAHCEKPRHVAETRRVLAALAAHFGTADGGR